MLWSTRRATQFGIRILITTPPKLDNNPPRSRSSCSVHGVSGYVPCLWPTETSCSMSIIDAVAARVAGCAHGCATTCEVPCEVRSEAPARVRARARGELVHGCGRRVEVGVAGVAPGGVRRVPAASGLDRPSRLGREPLKDSAWTWRTVNGRLWGSVLGLGACAGPGHGAHRAGRTGPSGVWTKGRALAPAPPRPRRARARFCFFFLRFRDFAARAACRTRLCAPVHPFSPCYMFIMII